MSWQATQPAAPIEAATPSWATGQGKGVTEQPKAKQDAVPTPAQTVDAVNPSTVKVEARKEGPKTSQSLLLLAMMIEGIAFGSLHGWAILKQEGVSLLPTTKKYLGLASVLGPLLVLDRDCCSSRLGQMDLALVVVHIMLSLKSLFERSLKTFGPWSLEKLPVDNTLATVAFWTHLRCFLHLLTNEAKGSVSKKLALLVSFALGSNLTVI